MKSENKAKKAFVKPEVKKHKAIAAIAGSGDSGCVYSSSMNGLTYYH
jgi:hypothetical protein